ncbi:MAG: tRNA (adenosine(37)-N6)-threonylcarbamoyltransferase complex ATPase subunit type 1 TsaE [Solobacterium sp.]|jgi:tRNA threonylcarbamoyladenosine biosynthesis protein TsaE|nr:tRNA (adenosine(37)-N6)-threonylcarbamoyltransferase complex ATPase subunit type 1 TsaE [Solobacterium sp.]MCH4205533.1 tRNA (adenosine(37)-N6)-threonylcarbamoyltransferase complex ATPase subunit type 1 TsaE [Solobacterium sp.]MCH4227132.1 tRNA (adenosine(37)-N6)-threonylcarbamoyltransferase complex ATPase subunit type 1 TsaE [Solobacterium sp.]MCH4282296.1 tRNA (adenosine(37)-N6)-threonylcarbamoyltransferase complex ATPase subunit type 1 TsaE [Solobacterium sp.]
MKEYKVKTESLEETHQLGEILGRNAMANMVFLLDGDLGAGKTTLTQGIAKGLDIHKNVTSPTFTIQKIYHGRLPLYHIDAYRLEGVDQDLGFEEYFYDDGLTVIEWSQFVPNLIPEEYMRISIKLLEENSREFVFTAVGSQYEKLLEDLK